MANDTHNVTSIEPQEIIPLKMGEIACVSGLKNCFSANTAVFELKQNTPFITEEERLDADHLEKEIQNGFSAHIAELTLKKAQLLERLKECALRSNALDTDLDANLQAELAQKEKMAKKAEMVHIIALILECDQCIAAVRQRERERNESSLTVAAAEQKPDSNLVRFNSDNSLPKPLSKSSCGFFAFKPKVSSTPENAAKPSASHIIPTVA